MRRLITALLGAAVVVTGGWGAAAPAMASTTAPAAHSAAAVAGTLVTQVNPVNLTRPYSAGVTREPLIGSYKLCLRSAIGECLVAEGAGNQMQITNGSWSTFNRTSEQSGYTYTTPNGLCVHGDTAGLVIGSTSCGFSNTASQWDPDSSSPPRYINQAYGGYMATGSNGNGAGVVLAPGSGWYYAGQYNI